MTRVPTLVLALTCALLVLARPVAADVTAFLGANMSPDARLTKGASLGSGLLVLGFEFEYADAAEDPATGSPSLRTGMANVLLQTPVAILRMQPYITTGTGLYRERLGASQDTGIGFNTGGGVKITLAGPLRLRLDYRILRLGDDAVVSPSHRVYAGLNLKF
jgi:opacity protein-like surface antigen